MYVGYILTRSASSPDYNEVTTDLMLHNMKNTKFPLMSTMILPKVSTLLYLVRRETLVMIYCNLYMFHTSMCILGRMVSNYCVVVGLSLSAPAVGWGSRLHAWLASVNRIGCACCPNTRYCYGARGVHYHILLRQYSQKYYTCNNVVTTTYSRCHKGACVQISIGNTE